MKKLLLFTFISCLLFACKTDQKKEAETPIEKKEINKSQKFDLPALPGNLMQKLFTEVTYIDYIFYDLPFSISQDDKPSINSNLQLMSAEKMGPISVNCKPIGREFFHIGGEIVLEAEVYFDNDCFGYVFLEKEKATYANKISESGMKFYSNIINQAEQIKNRALNGG